jgi:hypothetical protein
VIIFLPVINTTLADKTVRLLMIFFWEWDEKAHAEMQVDQGESVAQFKQNAQNLEIKESARP